MEISFIHLKKMENNDHQQQRYFQAKKKVAEMKGFYGNLAAFIFVNIGFLVVNLRISPEELWFYWPMLGWGLGIIIHWMRVFNKMPLFGKEWESKKIKKFIDQEMTQKNKYS